ncbi:MAG: hypothetical protein WCF51_07515 [Nitrosomonadaceae bacterium]
MKRVGSFILVALSTLVTSGSAHANTETVTRLEGSQAQTRHDPMIRGFEIVGRHNLSPLKPVDLAPTKTLPSLIVFNRLSVGGTQSGLTNDLIRVEDHPTPAAESIQKLKDGTIRLHRFERETPKEPETQAPIDT